jgi:hypothetical protein
VVKKYLTLLSGITRVILCSGNHDLDERSAEGEKIARWVGEVRELGIACDGDSLTISNTLFTVCPWWDGPLVKSRLETQLRDAAAQRLQQWIWVHHAPPANSPTSWGGKRFFGDVELVQWIKEQCIDLRAPLLRPATPIQDPPPWLISLGRIADGTLRADR